MPRLQCQQWSRTERAGTSTRCLGWCRDDAQALEEPTRAGVQRSRRAPERACLARQHARSPSRCSSRACCWQRACAKLQRQPSAAYAREPCMSVRLAHRQAHAWRAAAVRCGGRRSRPAAALALPGSTRTWCAVRSHTPHEHAAGGSIRHGSCGCSRSYRCQLIQPFLATAAA